MVAIAQVRSDMSFVVDDCILFSRETAVIDEFIHSLQNSPQRILTSQMKEL